MVSGSTSSALSTENIRSRNRAASHREVQSTVFVPPLRSSSMPCTMCRHSCGDRFIPARSSMDMDFAQYCLTGPRKEEENEATASPSKVAYRKLLAEICFGDRTRILAFKHKPTPTPPVDGFLPEFLSCNDIKSAKRRRCISQKAEKILEAPNIMNDYYLNLLDWGSSNVLAIALRYRVYLWNASNGSASKLFTVEEDLGPVTSVSWAPDGQHIAVGLNNSHIQLWDSTNNRLLRTLRGEHRSRVGALAWNNNILTTGDGDGKIVNNDVRIRSHAVQTYRGHTLEVCGLKWSNSGRQLASGGDDDLLHIWDISMSSSNAPRNQNQYMHRFDDHNAAVKALAWCPFENNLLASGGGANDKCIKFWNTNIGSCLNSIDTGSQVCSLLWNTKEHELLSSHGFTRNQLTLWKYPSMSKIAELTGHTSRVLFMAQSPDGCTVASAGEDETLRFWNVFGTPQVAKRAPKATTGPFSSINLIRLMMRLSRLKKGYSSSFPLLGHFTRVFGEQQYAEGLPCQILVSVSKDKFGVRSIRHSEDKMMSALCRQVSIMSQALIFVTGSRGWFFVERPGLLLVSAFFIAQLVCIHCCCCNCIGCNSYCCVC